MDNPDETEIPYSERELIQRAISNARPLSRGAPRWAVVKQAFGTGSRVSWAICKKYGFDPEEMVPELMTR
jgi:hypothetical protein